MDETYEYDEALQRFVYKIANNDKLKQVTDFTIICQGRRWKTHRFLLLTHSDILGNLCTGSFKEAREAYAELKDDPVIAVAALMEYIYKFDYCTEGDCSELALHVAVMTVADKYSMDGLYNNASAKFDAVWNQVAEPSEGGKRKRLGWEDSDVLEALQLAYWTYPAPKPVLDMMCFMVDDSQIINFKDGYTYRYDFSAEIEAFMRRTPDFATDFGIFQAQRFRRIC